MKRGFKISLAACVSMGVSCFAADSILIDTITVTADYTTEGVISSSKADAKKIQTGSSQTIADVLKNEAQIDVRKRTAVGDNGDILSIRGLSANRIMLNFDGRPLNAAGINGGHYIDWGTIPLENIAKIEVIKGGSSIEYGHNALGGVINIIPKMPTAKPTASIEAIAGAWNTSGEGFQNLRFSHAYKPSNFGYTISGSYENADAYLWNNDFEAKNIYMSLYYDIAEGTRLSFGFTHAYSKRGFIKDNNPDGAAYNERINPEYPISYGDTLAGGGNNPILLRVGNGAFWEKKKYLLDAGLLQDIGDGYAELKLFSNYEDRHEENFSPIDGHKVFDRDVQSDRTQGGTLKFKLPYKNNEFTLGTSYTKMGVGNFKINYYDQAFNGGVYSSPNVGTYIIQQGFFAGDSIDMFDKKLNLNIGARYDKFDIYPYDSVTYKRVTNAAFSPKMTLTYRINEANTVALAAYKNYRTPGIPESYWHFNAANPTPATQTAVRSSPLKPEASDNIEVSYKYKMSKDEFIGLNAFYMKIKDYLQWRSVSGTDRAVYNVDAVTIRGISIEGAKNLTEWAKASASLTHQNSKKSGDFLDSANLMESLEYSPRYKANAAFDFKLPFANSSFSTNTRYYSAQKAFNYQSRVVDVGAYSVTDISLKAPIFKGATLELFADNVFERDYQDKYGYATVGRVVGTAFRYNY
ncbi:MAG: TonB-dependent receptor plug domain-containing protein [Campylobacterales bacterium]